MTKSQHSSTAAVSVSRQLEARGPDENRRAWIQGQSYASLEADILVRAVEVDDAVLLRRSFDNGVTWPESQVIARKQALDESRVLAPFFETFYLDPDNALLVVIFAEYVHPLKPAGELYGDTTDVGPKTRLFYYRISRDAGRTWEPKQQVIERGPEFDADHWGRDLWRGRSALVVEGRALHKLDDGTIVAPCYAWLTEEQIEDIFRQESRPAELWDDAKYYLDCRCLFARWLPDLSGLEWESGGPLRLPGGYTHAGTTGADEPTIAYLDDRRWLAVLRTSVSQDEPANHVKEFMRRDLPMLRYCAVSEDGGRTWPITRPITYDDGSPLYSPSAYSEFIRSSRNGKWYWIANMLPEPTYGNCDPRHPLQIAELDEATLSIRKDTVTVIEDKTPEEPSYVRFSNFRVYEERGTLDFVLLMTKGYSELGPGYGTMPTPTYRYRISVPDA